VPSKVDGDDLTDLPQEYIKVSYAADKKAIKEALEAGLELSGWRLTNGGETISIRKT